MYKIEKENYGFKITFSDFMKEDEMQRWLMETERVLATQTGKFGVLIDMRTLKPLPLEAQEIMKDGQKLYKQKGMERSAVILNNAVTTIQFKRIANETGIYEWERYFDASTNPNWEAKSIDWISRSIDPDK